MPPLTSRAQTMRAILLARATVTSIFGLRANIWASHDPLGAPTPAGLLNHGTRPNDQQAPDRPFAAFRDGAELLLAAGGFLQRGQPEPGRKVTACRKPLRGRHQRCNCRRGNWPHARYRHQPMCGRVGLGAPVDLSIKLGDLPLERGEGVDQQLQNGAHTLGQGGSWVLDEGDQGCNMGDALRKDVAVLKQMPAQSVDALRTLTHQKSAGSENDGVRLLLLG